MHYMGKCLRCGKALQVMMPGVLWVWVCKNPKCPDYRGL